MNTAFEKQIIAIIEGEWERLPESHRPFGTWIRRYSPLPMDATDLDRIETMPEAVWFLDKNGLRVENVWSWMRYVTMRRFDLDAYGSTPTMHPVGSAAFALYLDGKSCYSETIWGPRFGRGWRWKIEENRLRGRDAIWVS